VRNFFRFGGNYPLTAVTVTVAVITILASIFVTTPWFGPPEAVVLFSGFYDTFPSKILTAVVYISLCVPTIYGAFKKNKKWLKQGAFWLFIGYFFAAVSRIVVIEYPLRLLWVPHLIVALVMVIVYLALGRELREAEWTQDY